MIKYAFLLFIFLLIGFQGNSQKYYVNKKNKFYAGFFGGTNWSIPLVTDKYSVLITTPQSAGNDSEKSYEPLFKTTSSQFGFFFSYSFTNKWTLLIQPGFQSYHYNYLTSYSWNDTVNGSSFAMEFLHRQKINTISIPVMARWELTTTRFSPYLQAGLFADFRYNASKTIYYDYTPDDEVDRKTADHTSDAGMKNLFNTFNLGVIGGIGATFYANHFAVSLESNYRFGFLKLVNDQNRYADETGFTTQYLDVQDQLKLMNLNVQLTVMFPLDNSRSLGILRKRRY